MRWVEPPVSCLRLKPDIFKVNDFVIIRLNKVYKIFTVLAASTSASSLLNTNILQGVPTTLMPLVLKMADEFYHNDSELTCLNTNLYLELTGGTRTSKHDTWDSLKTETMPINCVYELVKGLVVPSCFV